jgi:hypothetical protein
VVDVPRLAECGQKSVADGPIAVGALGREQTVVARLAVGRALVVEKGVCVQQLLAVLAAKVLPVEHLAHTSTNTEKDARVQCQRVSSAHT